MCIIGFDDAVDRVYPAERKTLELDDIIQLIMDTLFCYATEIAVRTFDMHSQPVRRHPVNDLRALLQHRESLPMYSASSGSSEVTLMLYRSLSRMMSPTFICSLSKSVTSITGSSHTHSSLNPR